MYISQNILYISKVNVSLFKSFLSISDVGGPCEVDKLVLEVGSLDDHSLLSLSPVFYFVSSQLAFLHWDLI